MEVRKTVALAAYPASVAAVAILSLIPVPAMGISIRYLDKIEHGLAYLVLGACGAFFYLALGLKRTAAAALSLATGTLLGAIIELIQPLAGRRFEFADIAADIIGAALGAGIVLSALSGRKNGAVKS